MTSTALPAAAVGHLDERTAWKAMAVIVAATMMVALDTTIVNVALEQIGRALHNSADVEWVVTAYLLAVCVSQPATGWMANAFGARRVLRVSLVLFTAASVACAAAPNLGFLIAARVVQGLGGGALMPVGMAMVLGLFPRERHGRAVSIWGMGTAVAPAIGPTVGGWIVTSVSWHWLFLVNGPVGIATFVAGLRLLPDVGARSRRPFDFVGLGLGSAGLSLAVLGLSEANGWGWAAPATVACLAAGGLSLAGFVVHELRTDHPMIELRMFTERSFRLAMGAMVFVFIAHFGRLVFLPLQLEGLRGASAFKVGLLFLPAGLMTAVAMPMGGRLTDTVGPRLPIVTGASMMLVAALGFATLHLATPFWVIGIFLCLNGFGIGLLTAPAMIAGVSDLPPHLTAQGTAVRSLMGQVCAALSVAILGAVIAARSGAHPTRAHLQSAYDTAFAVAAVGVVLSIVFGLRLPNRAGGPPAGEAAGAAHVE